MDFSLTEEQQQLRRSVREFAEGEIAPARDGVGRGVPLSRWRSCPSWRKWGCWA